MSVTSAELGDQHERDQASASLVAKAARAPVLITVHEVLFASSAAIAVPLAKRRRWRVAADHSRRTCTYYDLSLAGRERFRL
jgi:hypothetical protein